MQLRTSSTMYSLVSTKDRLLVPVALDVGFPSQEKQASCLKRRFRGTTIRRAAFTS
jgi:hypothetical protein